MKFSLVIPTYNRQEDLGKCLLSVKGQNELPSEILIIDDASLDEGFIDNWKKLFEEKGANLYYYKKDHNIERRGSSESRNKGLALINNDIFFILDDDVVLEPNFFNSIMNTWRSNKDDSNLIGVGGVIINHRPRRIFEKVFHFIFFLKSKYDWDVTKVGFQVWNDDINKTSFGRYAHGGVCSYDLTKTKDLGFSTFSGGRTALEDVDFCLRAKNKGYHFFINPKSRLYHYPSSVSRESMFEMGYKETVNRVAIFKSTNKKPSLFLKAWFSWSLFGWILRQVLSGNFSKARGMTKGIFTRNSRDN